MQLDEEVRESDEFREPARRGREPAAVAHSLVGAPAVVAAVGVVALAARRVHPPKGLCPVVYAVYLGMIYRPQLSTFGVVSAAGALPRSDVVLGQSGVFLLTG